MARLLINNEWFDEVSAKALRESEFENFFLENAETLYPDYYTIPFKGIIIESEYGTAKADLALIDKEYLNWWVIEVEMSRHSLNGHVLPQVHCLSAGVYGADVASYFHRKCPALDIEKLKVLMKGKQPRVMVVLDIPKKDWGAKLEKHNAILSVFQIFRSESGNHIYRVNGDYPHKFGMGRSKCQFAHLLTNFLKIDSPSILSVPDKEKVTIKIDGSITEWKRMDIMDAVYLYPISYNPLDIKKEYVLLKEPDSRYHIKEHK
ncbi:hypothetical protein [Ekhidna sp.]|uniref:hypothetical protein n=1 Tax=Ekhidna sp. TaxID=2608089 RepID=UPI00329857BB